MPLEKLTTLMTRAEENGYAVGYFEAWDTYSLEAVVEAAERERSPVVLGFGGMTVSHAWLERFGIRPLGAYGKAVAEAAKVPVAFILNEVPLLSDIAQGIGAGYNAVMLDSCHLPDHENIEVTRKVVKLARPHSIEVQAEFGRLPNFGEEAHGVLTDPDKAQGFVKATGVDCLAVSIGNVHLQTRGSSPIDLDRLKAIRKKVAVPLVIHGGTGFPSDRVSEVIRSGVSLFHFGTLLKKAALEAAKRSLGTLPADACDYQALVGSRKNTDVLTAAGNAVRECVSDYLRLYGSAGRAK
jgi:fructose-bisphosphate aldolase class II